MIKMIAFDMDGTLLTSNLTLDETTREMLMDLQQHGVRLVLASGRGYRKLLPYAKQLKMERYGGYLIEYNGSALNDLTMNTRQVCELIAIDDMEKILEFVKPYELEIQFMYDDGMYIYIPDIRYEEKLRYKKEHDISIEFPWTRGDSAYLHDNRIGYPHQVYIKEADEILNPVNKIGIAGEENLLRPFLKDFKEQFKQTFWIGRTSTTWLEITPIHISKANLLCELADRHHIKLDEIMAFGDGENDMEMLERVKYGIAMGNALDNVKEIAYDITDDHNHQGIAKALQKYMKQMIHE